MFKEQENDLVAFYINEAAQTPLLSFKEEVVLGKRIQKGLRAQKSLEKIVEQKLSLAKVVGLILLGTSVTELKKQGKKVSKDVEKLAKVMSKGQEAQNQMVSANLRLVVSIAKRLARKYFSVSFLDLIQVGNLGIYKAARKFDHKRGCRFGTYATNWIAQSMQNEKNTNGRTIRIPYYMVAQMNRYRIVEGELWATLGRRPKLQEIAFKMGMGVDEVRVVGRVAANVTSLDAWISEDSEDGFTDFLEDKRESSCHEKTDHNALAKALHEALDELHPKEREIMSKRFGLQSGAPLTLQELADEYSLSRERIRQIEVASLLKLQRNKKIKEMSELN